MIWLDAVKLKTKRAVQKHSTLIGKFVSHGYVWFIKPATTSYILGSNKYTNKW